MRVFSLFFSFIFILTPFQGNASILDSFRGLFSSNYSEEELSKLPLEKLDSMCIKDNIAEACNFSGSKRAVVSSSDKNWDKAEQLFSKGCELNNPTSCYKLARLYKLGVIKDRDEKDSTSYYEKACELKDLRSCLDIARYYSREKNSTLAEKYIDIGKSLSSEDCKKNNRTACTLYALFLIEDKSDLNDTDLTDKMLETECLNNDATACFERSMSLSCKNNMRNCSKFGEKACELNSPEGCYFEAVVGYVALEMGYKNDISQETLDKYTRESKIACESNLPQGCDLLGGIYSHEENKNKSSSLASKYYSYGCELKVDNSCLRLGHFYYQGIGVDKNIPLGLDFLEKSLELGNAKAGFYLGEHYRKVEGNTYKAIDYFKTSCDKKFSPSCDTLGNIYLFSDGNQKNIQLGRSFMEKSCELKNGRSCGVLGLMYYLGDSFRQDYSKSLNFADKACELNDEVGCFIMGNLALKANKNVKAKDYYGKACDLGLEESCKMYKDMK